MSIHRSDKSQGNYTCISNNLLRDRRLSSKARFLMALMLSLPENWVYSVDGLCSVSGLKYGVVKSAIHKLEENGYLVRRRTRSFNGQLSHSEWDIYEEPILVNSGNGSDIAPDDRIPRLDKPRKAYPTVGKERIISKDSNNMRQTNTMDMIDDACIWREQIESNIKSEELIERFGKAFVKEIVDLITDVIISREPQCRIGKSVIPRELVIERFRKLEPKHVAYVFECIKEIKKPIKNIKAYILSSLYNAPTTIEQYYDAQIRHDYPDI